MNIRNIFAILLVLLVTAACTGENSGSCLPSSAEKKSSAGGSEKNISEEIDDFILENKPISTILDKIKLKLIGDGSVESGVAPSMFDKIVKSPEYIGSIGAMFGLFMTFYGISVATGMVQVTLGDALIRAAKMGFIAVTAMNWDEFYGTIAEFFINFTDELIYYFMENFRDLYSNSPDAAGAAAGGVASGAGAIGAEGGVAGADGLEKAGVFEDLDIFIATVFSQHMFAIVAALFSPTGVNSGPYATFYGIFLLFSLVYLIKAIMKVVTIYAFSLFAKAILFALAPIFLAFLLFNHTKQLFDGWLKQLINYSLQPVLVTAFLGMFIGLITPLLGELLNLKVCYLTSNTGVQNEAWRFVKDNGDPLYFGVNSPPPIELSTLLLMFFFTWLFGTYISLAEQLASAITYTVAGNLGDIKVWKDIQADRAAGGAGGDPVKGGQSMMSRGSPASRASSTGGGSSRAGSGKAR